MGVGASRWHRSAASITAVLLAMTATNMAVSAASAEMAGTGAAAPTSRTVALSDAAACPRPIPGALSATAGKTGTVALTFDDGPHPVHTEQVLDVLRAHGIRATFFLVGQRGEARPELVRRTVREGHVMGNHTWSHPTRQKGADMDTLPMGERARQMDRTTDLIYELTGTIPCFYRSPQGAHRSAETQGLANERGMTVTHWGPSSRDAFQASSADPAAVQAIVERSTIPRRERPIVLLHDGGPDTGYRGNTVAALPEIIRFYERHGYTFTDPAGRPLSRTSPRIQVSAGSSAEAGRDVEVRGKSWALRVGSEVHLQFHRSGGWQTVATSKVDATNAFRVTLRSPEPGVLPLRVVAGSVTSNSLDVEVALPPGLQPATSRSIAPACPESAAPDPGFLDVAAGSRHAPAIHCLVWWQLAAGTSPTSYAPGSAVTRAQMATFLANYVTRTGGVLPDDPPTVFLDVTGDRHERAIAQLAAVGIVQGRNGRYSPTAPVTRGQMASYLVRAHEHRTAQHVEVDHRHFFDTSGTTHADAIDRAASLGLASGVDDHRYAPNRHVRRDQMASFLARLLSATVDDGYATPPA